METTVVEKNERVNFNIPHSLAKRATIIAQETQQNLSELFRAALLSYIKKIERLKLEKELEEGYKANYNYFANSNKEWGIVDFE